MELMLGDGDAFVQFMPFWAYAAEQWSNGTAPFWTPHIFGGYPLFAEPQASIFHPLKLLFVFLSPLAALNITVLLYYGFAGMAAFVAAREEGLTSEASLLAGISFAYCGFLIGHQGITALFMTASIFPLTFFSVRRLLRKNTYKSIFFSSLSVPLLVMGGHPQFLFYALFFALFYVAYLFFFVAERARRNSFLKSVAAMYVLGIALSAFQLLPTFELMTRSVRRELPYDNFVAASMPFPTLLTSLVSTHLYILFPNDGSEAMVDVGIPTLILALLGILLKSRQAWFWLFLSILSALLYLGDTTPLYSLMFYVPGYNLFQVASRNGVVLDFAVVMLAAHGLDALQKRTGYSWLNASRLRRGALIVLMFIVYYFGVYMTENRIFDRLGKIYAVDSKIFPWTKQVFWEHLVPQAPDLLVLVAASLLMVFLLLKAGGGRWVAGAAIVMVFLHFSDYRTWLFAAPAEQVRQSVDRQLPWPAEVRNELMGGAGRIAMGTPVSWISFLVEDNKNWRMKYLATGGVDVNMLHGIDSIAGYTPLVLSDYSRLAGQMHMSGYVNQPQFFKSPALSLLNVRFVMVPSGLGFSPDTFSLLERVWESDLVTIYRNPDAHGMFWGVSEVRGFSSTEFWKQMETPSVDFSETALLMDGAPVRRRFRMPSEITFSRENGNTVRIKVATSDEAFLASSQILYPGWFAWIDGKRTELKRVNGLFTGIQVPPGRHEIVLRFIPLSFWTGFLASLLSIAAFLVIAKKNWLRLAA